MSNAATTRRSARRPALTVADLLAGSTSPEWGGYGYLGARDELTAEQQARGDAAIITYANREGWSAADLFEFTNSRQGRHFSDQVTFGETVAKLVTRLGGEYVSWMIRERA